MTRTESPVVRKQVVVSAPLEQAFTAFTERFGDFKPPEHNLLAAAIAETVFEPRVGGHIYDRAIDGSECRSARILAYEPPARVVFSWDMSPQWQVETNPELTSEVEVRFVAEGPDRTRVELEHRHLDRHGPGWQSVSDGVDADQGTAAGPGPVRRPDRGPLTETSSRLTIAVDFDGHGIGKLLVPLIVPPPGAKGSARRSWTRPRSYSASCCRPPGSARSSTHTANGASSCSPSTPSIMPRLRISPAYRMPMRSITARERTL